MGVGGGVRGFRAEGSKHMVFFSKNDPDLKGTLPPDVRAGNYFNSVSTLYDKSSLQSK